MPMAILAPTGRPLEELPAAAAALVEAAKVAEVAAEVEIEVGPTVTVFTGRSEAFQLIWIMGA